MSLYDRILAEARLRLPPEFLQTVADQLKKTSTRRKLRSAGRAVAGPELPPVWGYLSPQQKKEWLKQHQGRQEVAEGLKTALAYGMDAPERYGGVPERAEDKKKKPKLPLLKRLARSALLIGKHAFPNPRTKLSESLYGRVFLMEGIMGRMRFGNRRRRRRGRRSWR